MLVNLLNSKTRSISSSLNNQQGSGIDFFLFLILVECGEVVSRVELCLVFGRMVVAR